MLCCRYDPTAGIWGCWGGPTQGRLQAISGLQIAPLPPDASTGNTGVFINGRNLDTQDLLSLEQIQGTQIPPNRFWVRSDGTWGIEGNPAVLGMIGRSSGSSRGGASVASGGDGSSWWDPGSGTGGASFTDSTGHTLGWESGMGSVSSGDRRKQLLRKLLQAPGAAPVAAAGTAGTGAAASAAGGAAGMCARRSLLVCEAQVQWARLLAPALNCLQTCHDPGV